MQLAGIGIDRGSHTLAGHASAVGERSFLCLHGLADTRAIWSKLADPLAARGRFVACDQRGHGDSGAPPGPYTREDLGRDALAVLDALEIERAIVIGHSLGGVVAMSAALLAPERVAGLVLLGTAGACNARTSEWYEALAQTCERDGTAALARRIYGERTRREIRGDAHAIAHVTRMLRGLHSNPLVSELAKVRCPVLLVVGDRDPLGPKASPMLRDAFERADLVVLPGVGHWAQVEAPDAVVDALDRWLEAHGGNA